MREASESQTATGTDSHAFFVQSFNADEENPEAPLLIMDKNGLHHYQVMFEYRGKPYTCEFLSSAEITPETNKLVAWGIADDAIKERMLAIPNRQEGIYPHSIVITGEYGSITVKE